MDLKDKTKLEIKKELISKDLNNLLKSIIIFLLVAGLFGYVGYIYSKDNNISISHGIIYGILFPSGIILLRAFDYDNILTCIIYTIAYIAIIGNVPTFVGAIILIAMILIFIVVFIYALKKDRTKEIEEYYNDKKQNSVTVQNDRRTAEDIIREYDTTKATIKLKDDNNEDIFKHNEDEEENLFKEDDYNLDEDNFQNENDENEEFECEMCFKKISREEYELYDFMCEECFIITHTDKYGNFHDDEFFDFL